MAVLYMSQSIVTKFAAAMVNNGIYISRGNSKELSKVLSAGFLISIGISILIALCFFISKDYLVSLFKTLSVESKSYALDYITYIIPFFILFNLQQYLTYALYALKLAGLNFILIVIIILFNIFFNYIAVYKIGSGIKGTAISSALSLLIVLPYYFWVCFKNGLVIKPIFSKRYYFKAFIGIKNLGFAAILEPILHQCIQFFIAILVALTAGEALSAKYHAQNFLTFALAFSLALGTLIQINIASFYSRESLLQIQKFYNKCIKYGLLALIAIVLLSTLGTYLVIGIYLSNKNVQYYTILIMLAGIIIEPARLLSIVSKAHLYGLQKANLPLVLSLLNKILLILPLLYLSSKAPFLGIAAVLIIETIGYIVNFVLYNYLINKFYIENKY